MTDASPPSETAELLGERSYLLFLGARFTATVATQIQLVTISWQIYQIAREGGMSVAEGALVLSMIGLVQFLPLMVLAPIAGQFADHHDRKTIMRLTLGLDVLAAGALVVIGLTGPTLLALFIVSGLFGVSRAFMMPASGSMTPMLVPRRLMPRALAWSSLGWQGATIVGPAVGGLLVAGSPTAGYVAAALLYLAAILMLSGITKSTQPERSGASRLTMIKEGLVYVWREKIVLGAISLDLFAVLLGSAEMLLPVFASDVLNVGPQGFGIMRASPGIGAALVAAGLAAWPVRRQAGMVMLWGVAVFSIATIVFGAAAPIADFIRLPMIAFPLAVVGLIVLGGADMLSVYIRQTLVQIVTPDHMRGRVAAVSSLFISGSNELGAFESGLVARFLGPVGAAVFGGVGALLVTGTWAKIFPDLRKADRLGEETAESDKA
jgi:MFS family permease